MAVPTAICTSPGILFATPNIGFVLHACRLLVFWRLDYTVHETTDSCAVCVCVGLSLDHCFLSGVGAQKRCVVRFPASAR